jgi:hypothetical protein
LIFNESFAFPTNDSVTGRNVFVQISIGDLQPSVGRRLFIAFKLPTNLANGGRPYDANTLLVKANRGGNRVRVVSTGGTTTTAAMTRNPTIQSWTKIDELFSLPYVVDPYRVMARLEPDSTLIIEAPIVG